MVGLEGGDDHGGAIATSGRDGGGCSSSGVGGGGGGGGGGISRRSVLGSAAGLASLSISGSWSAAMAATEQSSGVSEVADNAEVRAAVQQLMQDQAMDTGLVWSPIGSGKTLTRKDKVTATWRT